jgi:hypothetical protein
MGVGRRGVVQVAIALALSVALWASATAPAAAWEATNLAVVSQNEDRFWNYDCETTIAGDPTVCDWPVTIVFWGNATVDKVKNALRSSLPIYGVNEYFYASDGYHRRWLWVADTGVKSLNLTKFLHMRVYGGRWGRLSNATWGTYVLATTHYDINELTANPTSGRSEEAAAAIEALCVQAWGAGAVAPDVLPLFNAEADRVEQRANDGGGVDSHYWQCDGLATMVYVP